MLSFIGSLFLCVGPLSGQTGNAAGTKIGAIHVKGEKVISAEQFVAATGLMPGQPFDPDQLNAVATRLGKSGAFTDITYSYSSQGGLAAIDFKVLEGRFRACYFDNFVWLSDQQIDERLKKELPLYNGVVPETGEMLDDVSGVLERLSKEKGVTVRVSRRVQQQAIGDPNWSHMYVAEGANAKVAAIRFTGVQAVSDLDLKREAAGLVGRDYSAFQIKLFGESKVVPFYRERGFLQVRVDTAAPRIVSHAERSSDYAMEAVYAVVEGSIYKWSEPEWSLNTSLTAAALNRLTGMKANDIANGGKIDEGWAAIQTEYSKSGYLEARVLPEALFDEQRQQVHYRVRLTEGPQYHMGSFVVIGLPDSMAGRLKTRWRLKTGEVFDGSYPSDFLKKEVGPAFQGMTKPGMRLGMTTKQNKDQHSVDVTLRVE